MKAWGVTDKGMVRQQNQDSYHADAGSQSAVLMVCDGMGGAKAGNIASGLAVDTVKSELRQTIKPNISVKEAKHGLEMAVYRANRVITEYAGTSNEYKGMGTTFVGAVVIGKTAVVANIGDSRAYHISTGGGITRVTRDHSLVEDLLHKGNLTEGQARVHPKKNLITRALGTDFDVKADLFEVTLKKGDFLLLCSDGLTNMVDDQEILYEIIHGGDAEFCCDRLVTMANTRGGPDNITAVLFSV